MDVGSILLILALAVLVGVFVSRPFDRRASGRASSSAAGSVNSPTIDEQAIRRSALQAERERLLDSLSELDIDYSLGKVPLEDYPLQRTSLLQAGASVLRQLDELEPLPVVPMVIESEPVQPPLKSDVSQLCSKCGSSLHPGDLFCSHCGQKVIQE